MNIYLYLSIIFFIISLFAAKYKSKHIFNAIINSLSILLYFSLTILYFSADYFTNEGINDAVLFTVQYGLGGAGFGEYILLLSMTVFSFVVVFAITYMYFRVINNFIYPKPKKLKGAIHNIFLLLAFLFHPFVLDSYSLYQAHNIEKSLDFDQYYIKPRSVQKGITSDLNIVYIYAESLERTYFDEKIFPGLVKNLKQLKEKSTEFTNINQAPATGWTIGGMVASQCSIPLFTVGGENSILQTVGNENSISQTSSARDSNKLLTRGTSENSMGNVDKFLNGAECLGDILANLGYHLVYVQGASTKFSGKDKFYKTHKFNEIYGREELTSFLKDKSYVTGWGLYDDSTLDIAFEKYEKLSQDNKNFALFTLTLDTHHPNGHPSKSCKGIPYEKGENNILNAVHCSDYLISKFIRKIQNSKYANQTLIVLTSDHLAMKNTATKLLLKGNRKDLFLIFDPRNQKYSQIDKKGSMFDVAPTVLSSLGIDTDLGLGRNLFTKNSLYSSFENFDKKLLSWREDVLDLWEFPKATVNYAVNISNTKVNIANNSYKFPVLFKINENKELEPIFETYAEKKLVMYPRNFEPDQKFIWIDKCSTINILSDTQYSSHFCVAQGSLAGKIEITELKENINIFKANSLFAQSNIDMKKYYQRVKVLPLPNSTHFKYDIILDDVQQDIKYNIEKYSDVNNIVDISGWAFSNKGKMKNVKKYMVLQKDDQIFFIKTLRYHRFDVVASFKNDDLKFSGFKTRIYKKDFSKGRYDIGILLIENESHEQHFIKTNKYFFVE